MGSAVADLGFSLGASNISGTYSPSPSYMGFCESNFLHLILHTTVGQFWPNFVGTTLNSNEDFTLSSLSVELSELAIKYDGFNSMSPLSRKSIVRPIKETHYLGFSYLQHAGECWLFNCFYINTAFSILMSSINLSFEVVFIVSVSYLPIMLTLFRTAMYMLYRLIHS